MRISKTEEYPQSLILFADGKSCSDVWNNGHRKNGVYHIEKAGLIYCHMDNIPGCGNGGWTQVLKIDGTKVIFTVTNIQFR